MIALCRLLPPQDAESVGRVLSNIDKANGYVMEPPASGGNEGASKNPRSLHNIFQAAFSGAEADYEHLASVQELYMGRTAGDAT